MTVQQRIDTVAATVAADVSRRDVLKGAGGLSFALVMGAGGVALTGAAQARGTENTISAWVRIAADNSITIITPAAEMGQGSMTGVPIILAEELDADWSKVSLEMAPAEPKIYGYDTFRRGRSKILNASCSRTLSVGTLCAILNCRIRTPGRATVTFSSTENSSKRFMIWKLRAIPNRAIL